MQIKKITIENFMSFHKTEYVFPESGLFFVGGEVLDKQISNSNGAGKSSFFEAICFSLFGKDVAFIVGVFSILGVISNLCTSLSSIEQPGITTKIKSISKTDVLNFDFIKHSYFVQIL